MIFFSPIPRKERPWLAANMVSRGARLDTWATVLRPDRRPEGMAGRGEHRGAGGETQTSAGAPQGCYTGRYLVLHGVGGG